MWDSERERKKVSNIFQGRSDIYFVKINLSEINFFLLGLGFLNMHVRSLWAQKKILKKIFDLRHEKQFERRGVASYEELLILFFDSSFKRPSSCWSQCCHYSSKVCSLYDKPFDALWWCCWLHCYEYYNVLLKDCLGRNSLPYAKLLFPHRIIFPKINHFYFYFSK